MPRFTVEQIIEMKDPYTQLVANRDGSLIESRDELNKLSTKEKTSLVTKMVLDCPIIDLRWFSQMATGLHHPLEQESCFRISLTKALEVRQRILAISDYRNTSPQDHLIGKEFSADLYNQFSTLLAELGKTHAKDFALNLAKHTPVEDIGVLMINIRSAFNGTEFARKIGRAMTLNRSLRELKGDNPHTMFESRDFSHDLFAEFPELVNHHLNESEPEIASKLALAASDTHTSIKEQLEQLQNHKNFRLIHILFCANTKLTTTPITTNEIQPSSPPVNPYAFHQPSPQSLRSAEQIEKSQNNFSV